MPDPQQIHSQQRGYDDWYESSDKSRWEAQDTKDTVTRYLLDRRLALGFQWALRMSGAQPGDWSALTVCGGAGGEATFLLNYGLKEVTVSDLSEAALTVASQRDPRLKTMVLNAEDADVPDGAFDLVLVREGLHHLPHPVAGLAEMLRIARRAVIMIEPHSGLVPRMIGTDWERHGEALNYVFRWNRFFFEQCVFSTLLQGDYSVKFIRLWDHSGVMLRVARALGGGRRGLLAVRAAYGMLAPLSWIGNAALGLVVKHPLPEFAPRCWGLEKQFRIEGGQSASSAVRK